MTAKNSTSKAESYRFSIAPMLDCTDKYFRVIMRQISKRALVYSEMVVAQAIHHSKNRKKLLDFYEIEHPISLQIGGDDPNLLAEAAQIGEEWGYDEINLNLGCPSPRVQSGNFGACLMANPKHVATCIETISKKCALPITIKHRVGIDELDNDFLLTQFVDILSSAGAKRFSIHARKAWLKGLNPKENRTIPPLQYERVKNLKERRPDLKIELNGGLNTVKECLEALKYIDGTMVGRAAYEHPLRWKAVDEIFFGEPTKLIKASNVIKNIIPFAEDNLIKGGKNWDFCRHLLNLVEGVPGARKWRNELAQKSQKQKYDIKIFEEVNQKLIDAGE